MGSTPGEANSDRSPFQIVDPALMSALTPAHRIFFLEQDSCERSASPLSLLAVRIVGKGSCVRAKQAGNIVSCRWITCGSNARLLPFTCNPAR